MTESLLQPVKFARSGKIAPNVFLKSAMTERLCTWDDANPNECGKPTPEYLHLYEEWGKGQIGVIVLGNIPADRRYPEAKRNAIIDRTSPWDAVAAFKPVIKACKAHGSLVIGQLTHAGRQTSDTLAPTPVSSSDVQGPPLGGMTFGKPRPLTVDEIRDIVERFAFAAKTLYDAGADGVQLHAAHGYLFSQFLSPRVNKRTDQYGGDSLDNRSRLVFEVLDAIKAAVADEKFLLSIKINSADFSEGGFDEVESREMAVRLEAAGVDIIELSGGTYENLVFVHKKESTRKREAYFVEFADQMRPHLRTAKLCVTGGFRSTEGMARALADKATDLIGLGRPLTAEPRLCADLLSGKATKARVNHVNEGMQIAASYVQLGALGEGRPVPDLADESIARRIEKAVEESGAASMLYRANY